MKKRSITQACEECGQRVYEGEVMYFYDGTMYCPECFRTVIDDMSLDDIAHEMGVYIHPVGGFTE